VVNAQLMFTIAQVSSAFVAIVAGFYTSKIITISSEKQRIQNKIAETNTEIEHRAKIANVYQGRVDETLSKWAKERVDDFVGDLLADEDDLHEYSIQELRLKFKEITHEEPDKYEDAILERERNNINERIRAELNERKPKDMTDYLSLALTPMALNSVTEKMRRENNRVRHLALPSFSEIERKRLDDAIKARDAELNQISVLSGLKSHHEGELKSLSLPGHIGFGFASQVVFAIFGIAIPLYFATWPEAAGDDADRAALIWFALGITTVFTYILTELISAIHKGNLNKEKSKVFTSSSAARVVKSKLRVAH
jgi:hypothetical protein